MQLRSASLWLCLWVAVPAGWIGCGGAGTGPATVAEVEVVRPGVTLGGQPVDAGRPTRASAAGAIATSDGGRAWVRLDVATRLLLDGATQVTVAESGVVLDRGRAWVEAATGAHASVSVGQVVVDVSGAALEIVRTDAGLQLHVGRGEVTYVTPQGRGQVRSGENAEFSSAAAPRVTPAALWDDWTGGLAWPDPGNGGDGRRGGVGEIGARRPGSLGEARFPLAITRLEVRTHVDDDLATTRVTETFFNPASDMLEGLYRVRIPEGAILQRFAIDRNGRWADGVVKERETARTQYQAQVYEGSTKDPALLEWEAPGSFKARIYPIPAGASRRILVEYSEWLAPSATGIERSWRYPMASGVEGPIIQELDVEVDTYRSGAKSVRAGLGARIEGQKILLERSDFRPTADLVVDLVGIARSPTDARGYRSPHRMLHRVLAREEDYYLLRTIPLAARPTAERVPLDLVILTDVSAATDATHLQMARTMVEALLRHLDDKDRVAVLGADLDVHRPGPSKEGPQLMPASRAATAEMLDSLARQGVGGASDLGAVLTQAAALLDEKRHGAVVYIGDALPTVGELNLKALRERLDRLPAPLRLYGVAIGDDADLGLLAGLSSDGGLALRVGSRSGAADAALRILGHVSRRALYRVQVDLGSGVDNVYPRRPVTLVEGQELDVLARVRSGVPTLVKITGRLEGKPFESQIHASSKAVDAVDDIRLRWASERLAQLLADGATTEEIAELGVRQNLITPYTSYYVPSADELTELAQPPLEARGAGCAFKSSPSAEYRLTPSTAESSGESEEAPSRTVAREAPKAMPTSTPTAPAAVAAPVVAAQPPPPPGYASGGREKAARGMKDFARNDTLDESEHKESGADKKGKSVDADGVLAPMLDEPANKPMATSEPKAERSRRIPIPQAGDSGVLGFLGSRSATGSTSSTGGGGGSAHHAKKRAAGPFSNEGGRFASVFGRDLESALEPNVEPSDDGDQLLLQINIFGHRARHCSTAASLSFSDRAVLWRERLSLHRGVNGAMEVWQDAGQGCELKSFADRRELLRAMLGFVGGAAGMVQLYQHFNDDPAAQDYLRRAILGLVRTAADLRVVSDGIGLSEDVKWTLVEEILAKAKTPEERVARLEQLAAKWPSNLRLKLRRMEAFEAVHRIADARRLADEVRSDPYADAQARTLVGELLVRLSDVGAARRAFSEIVEFAPKDPQARRRLGDLYRAHGWYDEAFRQYQTLGEMTSGDDPVVLLLEGLAAAGAGRIDQALGFEQRVADGTEPGAATGIARVALWWTTVRLALLRADSRQKGNLNELARLFARTDRANVLASAVPFHVFLTWAHPEADCELQAQLPGGPMAPATDVAPEFGIASLGSRDPLTGPAVVEITRPSVGAATSGLRYQAQLIVILHEGDRKQETLQRCTLEFGPGRTKYRFLVEGDKVEVQQ